MLRKIDPERELAEKIAKKFLDIKEGENICQRTIRQCQKVLS